jgi:hypothetical protein
VQNRTRAECSRACSAPRGGRLPCARAAPQQPAIARAAGHGCGHGRTRVLLRLSSSHGCRLDSLLISGHRALSTRRRRRGSINAGGAKSMGRCVNLTDLLEDARPAEVGNSGCQRMGAAVSVYQSNSVGMLYCS